MTRREFLDKLQRRAAKAGVRLGGDVAASLEAYYRLLTVWNERINLTGFSLEDAPPNAVDRLLIEPLVATRYLPATTARLLDVGSGNGSPALPMAIERRRMSVLMVESKTRKAVFLREAVRVLGLDRADVATARVEELLARPDLHEANDVVTVRAVRTDTKALIGLQAFVKPGGAVYMFRSSASDDSPASVPPPLVWKATHPLVESLGSRLVVLEKLGRNVPRGTP